MRSEQTLQLQFRNVLLTVLSPRVARLLIFAGAIAVQPARRENILDIPKFEEKDPNGKVRLQQRSHQRY